MLGGLARPGRSGSSSAQLVWRLNAGFHNLLVGFGRSLFNKDRDFIRRDISSQPTVGSRAAARETSLCKSSSVIKSCTQSLLKNLKMATLKI